MPNTQHVLPSAGPKQSKSKMKLSTFLKFFYPTPYKVRNRLRKGKEIRDLDLGGFGDDWLCDQGLVVSLTH